MGRYRTDRWTASTLSCACILCGCSALIDSDDATYRSAGASALVIESSETRTGDNFGTALTVDGDELIVVAATADLKGVRSTSEATCGDVIDASNSGRIHVFERRGGGWRERGELKRTSASASEGILDTGMFYTLPRIGIAREGRVAVVGVPAAGRSRCLEEEADAGASDTAASQAGKAYVFELDDEGRWNERAVLTAGEPFANVFFGTHVAIQGDRIFVAAPGDGSRVDGVDAMLDKSGAVYVFARDGATFRPVQRITPNNAALGAQFGSGLAVDGDAMAVGAWFDPHGERGVNPVADPLQILGSGAAYVFRERDGEWKQEAYIKAFNREAGDLFGASVLLHGDLLLVGAPLEDGAQSTAGEQALAELDEDDKVRVENAGAVYAFTRDAEGWRFDNYIKALEPRMGAAFGVALSFDGDRLVVGAASEPATDETGQEVEAVGAVYLYERIDGTFLPIESFRPETIRRGTLFGFAADLEGDTLAIGSPETDVGSGAVTVIDLRGR